MRVLALNGSPRVEESNTERLLRPLLEGMAEAGAEIEDFYLAKLTINYCTGCFGCWVRTPGKCYTWRDDMEILMSRLNEADLLVLGFPLYVYTIPARVKTVLERLLPRAEPWFVPHPDCPELSVHPRRYGKLAGLFIVSSAGMPEREAFSSLTVTIEHIAKMTRMPLKGMLLRPAAGILQVPEVQGMLAPYYAAVRRAGAELVRDGRVSEATQAVLDAELLPGGREAYIAEVNSHWQARMAKHGNLGEAPSGV